MMSWATDGDLKGVSAASCVTPALKQSLMVSGTKTGITQQLVVANPSAKATSVNIKVWGSDKAGALALSTGSTLTVGAGKESILNLAAAASEQDALYVTVSSEDTPVAAMVRTITMDGLTSKGSDYAVPNNVSAKTLAINGLSEGDDVNLYVYPSQQADVTVSWTDGTGTKNTNQQTLEANRVSVIDLGSVPKSATGLTISATEPVTAAAKVTNDGDGDQADFALVNASVPMNVSAIAVPDHATAQVSVTNTSDDDRTATLTSYNGDGDIVEQSDLTIRAGASTTIELADINDGDVAAVSLADPDQSMVWNIRVSQKDVSDAKLAGVSIIGATDLKEAREQVWSNQNMTIVRSAHTPIRVDLLRTAPIQIRKTQHHFVSNRELKLHAATRVRLQRHTIQHYARWYAMLGRKRLRSQTRCGLPRRRVGWRHILDSKLHRCLQFRPRLGEPADLCHQHIVEHAASCTIPWKSRAEHRRSRSTTMTISIHG